MRIEIESKNPLKLSELKVTVQDNDLHMKFGLQVCSICNCDMHNEKENGSPICPTCLENEPERIKEDYCYILSDERDELCEQEDYAVTLYEL